jgi:hypothetical protein
VPRSLKREAKRGIYNESPGVLATFKCWTIKKLLGHITGSPLKIKEKL